MEWTYVMGPQHAADSTSAWTAWGCMGAWVCMGTMHGTDRLRMYDWPFCWEHACMGAHGLHGPAFGPFAHGLQWSAWNT